MNQCDKWNNLAACILVICDQGGYKNHPTLPAAPGVRLTACSPLWATSSYSHTVRPSRTGLATNVVWNRHRRFKAWPETWHTSMTCLASGHYTVEAVWLARTAWIFSTPHWEPVDMSLLVLYGKRVTYSACPSGSDKHMDDSQDL